jgi:hypothetical protein
LSALLLEFVCFSGVECEADVRGQQGLASVEEISRIVQVCRAMQMVCCVGVDHCGWWALLVCWRVVGCRALTESYLVALRVDHACMAFELYHTAPRLRLSTALQQAQV